MIAEQLSSRGRYAAYRDSGFEWLGDVPSHWGIVPFRFLFRESSEKNGARIVGEMLSVSGYHGVTDKVYDSEYQKRSDEDLADYRVVRRGQLAVNTMWLNYAGLGVSSLEGHMSPAYRAYWIDDRLDKAYTHHLLRSTVYVDGYCQKLYGIRPNSYQIKSHEFLSTPILIPPMEEQRLIAAFLDLETRKIDALVEKKRRLIELLKEKRAAMISHAVTKGLDPTAPMKDSGILWVGQIPAHWEVTRLSRVCSTVTDGAHIAPETTEPDRRFVSTVDLRDGHIDLENCLRTSEASYKYMVLTRCKPEPGDVLFSKDGSIGKTALVPPEDFVVASSLVIIRPRPDQIHSAFLEFWLNNVGLLDEALALLAGTALKRISVEKVSRLVAVVPPLHEQAAISTHLTTSCQRIKRACELIASQIENLQEYRSALISAAVTGKIDVREDAA